MNYWRSISLLLKRLHLPTKENGAKGWGGRVCRLGSSRQGKGEEEEEEGKRGAEWRMVVG